MTREKLREWQGREAQELSRRPRVIVMGFIHWDELRCEVMSSVAECIPCKPGDLGFDEALIFGRMGVQNFFYNGCWILRVETDATCGPYYL